MAKMEATTECSRERDPGPMDLLAKWSIPPNPPILTANQIHLWRAELREFRSQVERFLPLLSAEETARAQRFVFSQDRENFIVGRGILRELLGRYLGMPPAKLPLETRAKGKPTLGRALETHDVRFNLSHSAGLSVFAFCLGREVGVDIERIRPDVATDEIAERYFSSREWKELRALPSQHRTEAFFLCWTRKEAYVKAHGDGLHIPLDKFDVTVTPGTAAMLHSADAARWSLFSFSPKEGYVGALIAELGDFEVQFWDWRNWV